MPEQSESEVETWAVKFAATQGYISRKLKWIGRRNAMDRAFFGNGRCIIVEFKRPGAVPEERQKREYERIRKRYPDVHVVDNIEDARRLLTA